MELIAEEGFWHQWDIQVLNFQIVSGLNIFATIFIAAMSQTFNFTKLVDFSSWELQDLYLFLGPVIAQIVSLLLVDSATWLVNYDFGAANEMILYWGVLVVNLLIQAIGNGGTLLVYGVSGLTAFMILGASALLPVVALSNPLFLVLFIIFFLAVIAPLMVDAFGFFLFGSFFVLTTALGFDSVYLLITQPDTILSSFGDVYSNGLASAILSDFENTIEEYLGTGFVHLFGTETLQEILDDFGLHLGLQLGVVLPLAVLLTVLKGLAIVGGLVIMIVGLVSLDSDALQEVSYGLMLGGLLIMGYFIVFDGTLAGLMDSLLILNYTKSDIVGYFTAADIVTRSFAHSLYELETDYWGIYFIVRLVMRWTSGYYTQSQELQTAGEDSLPQVGQNLSDISTIGDLASFLTPDNIENADSYIINIFTKPMAVIFFLPLVQGLTWSFQAPFFEEMKYHIRGLGV